MTLFDDINIYYFITDSMYIEYISNIFELQIQFFQTSAAVLAVAVATTFLLQLSISIDLLLIV